MPSMKSANPTTTDSPSALKAYFLAARPRTWIASLSPVLIGTVMSAKWDASIFCLTMLFSLLIQIGTNFANDTFDFLNGADTELRVGPKRAVQQGWISVKAMQSATLIVFAFALFIALILAGLWSLPIAALCIAFGVLYTGGPKPLGYLGLGEVLVLVFFGPVATCGTCFLQTGTFGTDCFLASLSPGLLSCSILIANNLRDETSDRMAGKNTLVVRFGKTFGQIEHIATVVLAALVPFALVFGYGAPLKLLSASLICLFMKQDLQRSALLLLLYTVLFCISFISIS